MSQKSTTVQQGLRVLGIDVAKDGVVVFDSVHRRTQSVINSVVEIGNLLQCYRDYDLAVCECTGGYERATLQAAHQLGLPIHRADPSRVKRFIQSYGGRAKTDAIDARWLAEYGHERYGKLARWVPPTQVQEALVQWTRLRSDLTQTLVQMKNRLQAPTVGVGKASLSRVKAALVEEIRVIDQSIDQILAGDEALQAARKTLCGIIGIGPRTSATLLAQLPELGHISRRRCAHLASLAPHPKDSGTIHGYRKVHGGRVGLRSLLFMCALTAAKRDPVMRAFYEGLIARGKAKMCALIAVARKLIVIANAKLRDQYAQMPANSKLTIAATG